jgi:hypothetical protein
MCITVPELTGESVNPRTPRTLRPLSMRDTPKYQAIAAPKRMISQI